MLEYFMTWQPAQLIALCAVLAVLILGLAALRAYVVVRNKQADAVLRQAMLQRGLSVDDMERLLKKQDDGLLGLATKTGTVENVYWEMVQRLRGYSPSTVAAVLRAYKAADGQTQELLSQALHALLSEDDATEEQVLAVVRSLADADEDDSAEETPSEQPAS